jgi:pyruvate formate lyase activating enzyme
MVTRRSFIKIAALAPFALRAYAGEQLQQGGQPKEALYYRLADEKKQTVACLLCPRACVIAKGETGFCRARMNVSGKLYSLGYAKPCAAHVDPIEKKPFFNVLPRTTSFSIASAGCNLRCRFCQNWQISQISPSETTNMDLPAGKVLEHARRQGCRSIAYTYTEPTNFYEYMLDTAKTAKGSGMLNIYHSNGYINEEPLLQLCKYLDAANIDLKGFSPQFYRKYCEAELEPVLNTIRILKRSGVWVEITNLVIPGHNDDAETIQRMCNWIRTNAGPDVPIHFSRFFPMYRMTGIAPTPLETLERAREIGLKSGLHYVYLGNVPGHAGENTYCPKCRKMVIQRRGYGVLEYQLKSGGKCRFCGEKIGGIWAA